jgi:hypothetical protein
LTPVPTGLRQTSGTVSPGERQAFQVEKVPGGPTNTIATTTTAPPTPTTAPRTPVTTVVPATTGTTLPPDEPESLADYCARMYPPPEIGPGNPMYTLCMHDPTV